MRVDIKLEIWDSINHHYQAASWASSAFATIMASRLFIFSLVLMLRLDMSSMSSLVFSTLGSDSSPPKGIHLI